MYTIKAYYRTGDSFGSEDTSDMLGYSVSSLETAEKALQYLGEHYKACESRGTDKPTKAVWYCKGGKFGDEWKYSVMLPLDDGTLTKVCIPYQGYFEQLQYLEVTLDTDKLSWAP